MLHAELAKRKLKDSVLGLNFHVRDMVGSGHLIKRSTTVGCVLQVA